MQKYGDVAMYMQTDLNNINFLFPEKPDLTGFVKQLATEPFSQSAIEFLHALSQELNLDPRIRTYPDVATFGFFCRRSNILQLKKQFVNDQRLRLGRGLVFHIAPSNVAVNFAFSLVCGILAGNLNIVRLPSKAFAQVDIISGAIKKLAMSGSHGSITDRIVLTKYERQSSATAYFSSICDVRVIWGGDETIAQIRENPLPPRAYDVTFADRYSLCAINADAFVNELNPMKVANGFYNDTFLFDQNACTSPHIVIWLGGQRNIENAKQIFWGMVHETVASKYVIQPIMAVDKITSFFAQAVNLGNISQVSMPDNYIWRIELEKLPENIDDFRCSGGYFAEYHASSLSELTKIINRKYQTMAYYGFDKDQLTEFIKQSTPQGIDRIVPIGRTSDFSLIWDGFNLLAALSRTVEIVS